MPANIDEYSPYFSAHEEPTLQPSFVCFADILGYSELSNQALSTGEGDAFLRRLSSALNSAYRRVRERANNFRTNDLRMFDIKIFTDNIVIGYPVDNVEFTQGESELAIIFQVFSEFQMELFQAGFLLRGGIAFGLHYMDNDVVFGDALLSAVKLDKNGGPPYLSLDSEAVKRVQGQLAFYGAPTSGTPQHYFLREDSDGKIFVNYLSLVEGAFPDGDLLFDLIAGHRSTIESGLRDYRSIPSVRAKYEWVARYHNYYCREFAQSYPVSTSPEADPEAVAISEEAQRVLEYIIDIEAFAAEPRPLSLESVWHGGD